MDYEKKYNEALERARALWQEAIEKEYTNDYLKDYETIFPELHESEDEKVIKALETFINQPEIAEKITFEARIMWLSWLEKQKENPKNAISIPADCATNAKCEDRWHKTANSLPDDGRDVLAKDALGNYLLASFDGAQWFVSVYDGEDHPVLHTPPILEWCEIPSEKQKEPHYTKRNALFDKCVENCDPEVMKEVSNKVDEMLGKEQKPAWSEDIIRKAVKEIGLTQHQIDWFKTNVFPPKPAWSEEDEKIMETMIRDGNLKPSECAWLRFQVKERLKFLRPGWYECATCVFQRLGLQSEKQFSVWRK